MIVISFVFHLFPVERFKLVPLCADDDCVRTLWRRIGTVAAGDQLFDLAVDDQDGEDDDGDDVYDGEEYGQGWGLLKDMGV